MPTIKTWGGRKDFDYDGNIAAGVDITYGENDNTANYSNLLLRVVLHRFAEETIRPDTLENWISEYKTRTAHSQYLAAFLFDLGEVQRAGDLIHFHQTRDALAARGIGL